MYVMQPGDRIVVGRVYFDDSGELVREPRRLITADGREIDWGKFTSRERPKRKAAKKVAKRKTKRSR